MVPVLLLIVDPESQILLQPLIGALRLSVRSWMIGGGDVLFDPQEPAQLFHESARKSGVPITDYFGGDSESGEDLSEV